MQTAVERVTAQGDTHAEVGVVPKEALQSLTYRVRLKTPHPPTCKLLEYFTASLQLAKVPRATPACRRTAAPSDRESRRVLRMPVRAARARRAFCVVPSAQRASEDDAMLGEVAASLLSRGGRAARKVYLTVACATKLLLNG